MYLARCRSAGTPSGKSKFLKIEKFQKVIQDCKKVAGFIAYASMSSSSRSLFGGGFGGSPFVMTLMSHFKYPLGPPVMSSGSVKRAHL